MTPDILAAPQPVDRARLTWRKSSYSNGAGGMCVEVAPMAGTTAVRDSKNPDGPILVFTDPHWRDFVARVGNGSLEAR